MGRPEGIRTLASSIKSRVRCRYATGLGHTIAVRATASRGEGGFEGGTRGTRTLIPRIKSPVPYR